MIAMQGSTSIAANATNVDVLSGQRDQVIDPNIPGAILAFYVNGSATGLTVDIMVGQSTPGTGIEVNTQNRSPVVPDDMLMNQVAGRRGEYIRIRGVNGTGGALTLFWRVEIEEVHGN